MRDRQTISCNHIEGVIKDFSDKAFCVLSHCDTDKKINQLEQEKTEVKENEIEQGDKITKIDESLIKNR